MKTLTSIFKAIISYVATVIGGVLMGIICLVCFTLASLGGSKLFNNYMKAVRKNFHEQHLRETTIL